MSDCYKCKYKEKHFVCVKCGDVIHTNQSTRNGGAGLTHDICPGALPKKQKVFIQGGRLVSDK